MEKIPSAPGIYRITCTITGKFYVGSATNLRARRSEHLRTLRQNIHKNSKLQHAWKKHGEEAFIFEVLELVLIPEMLTAREQYFFDTLKPFGERGFNLAPVAGSSLGVTFSLETRQRISNAMRGKKSTRVGWKPTHEQIEQHRQAMIGYKQTEEHKRNAAATRIGKNRSPETREKMRLAALGHAPTNAKTFIVTSPDGTEYTVTGLKGFCREHHLHASTLIEVAKGKRTHHKGWTARYPDADVS